MSLADALATEPVSRTSPIKRGPAPACEIYGKGDMAAFAVLLGRRLDNGEIWSAQQSLVDTKLGVTSRIKPDKFRYHWSGKCAHWDHVRDDLDALLEQRQGDAA